MSLLAAVCLAATPGTAAAQSALSGEPIHIGRATGPITVDGDLSDPGWRGATRVEKWYETQPGDNLEPKVRNVGYLAYDEHFLYAAFEFEDPDPRLMRAPFADRDNIGNGFNDYGGIIIDPRNTGRTATFFVATPRNIQYDSVTDDASGEDASPDFFWESAAKIGEHGWTLEMRIPFSSLRYRNIDPQTWGILLYRNYPRERHYQFFSARIPRSGNCFICRSNTLVGLEHLPAGGHIVAAPYLSVAQNANPQDGVLGSPLVTDPVKPHVGLDLKYTPNADNALDLTVKPDFSQVESDTAQISTNQRFALFFPEKRPFFLEGADLFQTPIQAVYTRTITAPDWGGRVTGKEGGVRYTVLVADDQGGGSVVLPGSNGSSFADQDFGSTVFIARAKRDMGLSFLGAIATDREARDGNGYNRVAGPDFQWRPSGEDVVTGQLLYSDTQTPNRPDLADQWTGQTISGHAGQLQWNHNATHVDWYGQYRDLSDGFRADSGFVPQVGVRELFGGGGWTFRPTGFLTRFRGFFNVDHQADPSGGLISREFNPGFGMDTKWNGFVQFRYMDDRILAGTQTIGRRQFGYTLQFSPSRHLAMISVDGTSGTDIDFDNSRPGRGNTINLNALVRPGEHLELALVQNQQFLNEDDGSGADRRLFVARVSRLKSTYTFTARLFARGIAQYVSTTRDPSLYISTVAARSGDFSGSALLAYKLNWQSVMFIGYGDDRELTDPALTARTQLARLDRQFFVKISYAFQR